MTNPRIPYEMATSRKKLMPPDGKPLIVHVVVNVEHWRFDHAMPRKIITAPHGLEQIPDIPNFTWAEYGMRCGMPRILKALGDRELPASTSFNAGVIEAYPDCAEAMLKGGWEFIGHGLHQRSMQGENDEAGLIQKAIDLIDRFTGKKTRGWLSPGLKETDDTLDILKEAGIDYVNDWVLDDLPTWITTKNGPMIALPYNLEINDSIIYAIEKHSSPEIYQRLVDTIKCFESELKNQPRVLAIGLHPHLMGVPHRIGYLEKMLELLMQPNDTIFMTGSQITDWFVNEDKRS
jgi:allantoinase